MRTIVVTKDTPEEVMLMKRTTMKQLLEIFHDIEIAENKVLEADPNLERNNDSPPRQREDAPLPYKPCYTKKTMHCSNNSR